MCSYQFRPSVFLQYEHMFSSQDTPPLARRIFGALGTIRSFLLLEDDYDVDWEVDQDGPIESHACGSRLSTRSERDRSSSHHPHRMALQSRLGDRRPGAGVPREQVCLCPLPARSLRGQRESLPGGDPQRGSRITTGSVRVVIDR
jgi:hypothetical protein